MSIDEHGECIMLTEVDDNGEATTKGTHLLTEVRVKREGHGLRIILDPFGEDHDILIECLAEKWLVIVHPRGQDPVCGIELTPHRAEVMDCGGTVFIKEEF